MKKLYFIRHGQSELNVRGFYAGRTETPLTEEGRRQAKETGRIMKAKGIKIDLIVSSPLSRALETAQIVARQIGYPIDQISVNDLVIERDFGRLERQPWASDHDHAYQKQFGIEEDEQLLERARKALNWLEEQPADNILVVSHGATGRALRSLVKEDFPMSHPHKLANAELHEWL